MRSTDRNDSDFDREVDDVLRQSQLATRLNRRGAAPIGVIDVRHPQYLYERTAGWIAQRFPLLAYFMTRYGSDAAETSGYGGLVYTSASAHNSEEPSSPAALGNHTPQVFDKPSIPMSTSPEDLSRQPEMFRASRRRLPALAGLTSSDRSFGLLSGEEPSTSDVTIHEAKEGIPVVVAQQRQVTADVFTPSQARLLQMSFQERQQTSEVPEAKRSLKIVGPPPTPVQPIWQKANPIGLTAASGVKEFQPQGAVPARTKIADAPIGSRPFLAGSNEQREQFVLRRGISNAVRSVEGEKQNRNGASELQNMVWRKNPNSSKGAGPEFRASEQGLVPQLHQVLPSTEPRPSPLPSSFVPQPSTVRDLDIGEIAEKVSRVIVSRLVIERERRGVKPWR